MSMVLAAVILIITIVTLYLVTNNNVRLGLICAFTVGFALSVHLLTNARRAELFAATAAYVGLHCLDRQGMSADCSSGMLRCLLCS